MSNLKTLLVFKNRGGSIEHYFHFLLGFLVPLLGYLEARTEQGMPVVRSCGPLDGIVRELRLPVEIVAREAFERFVGEAGDTPGGSSHVVDLPGLDDPKGGYDEAAFVAARQTVRGRMPNEIRDQERRIRRMFGRRGPRVVLIDRGPSDPFYRLGEAERKTSGRDRRSLPNFAEIAAALDRRFNLLACQLEDKPLAWQVALFGLADVIVAQHGAGLTNLIWASPGAALVVINPDPEKYIHFEGLGELMGLQHRTIRQTGDHDPVPPDEVISAITALRPEAERRRRFWLTARRLLSGGTRA